MTAAAKPSPADRLTEIRTAREQVAELRPVIERIAYCMDGADDPEVSVRAFWSKPNERKHLLLDDQARMRAPPRSAR